MKCCIVRGRSPRETGRFATGRLQLSAIDTGIREKFHESPGQRQKNAETRRKRGASIRRKAEDRGKRAIVHSGGEEGAFAHEGERGVFRKKKLHAPEILLRLEAAGGVEQDASGTEQRDSALQDRVLQDRELGKASFGEPPRDVGTTARFFCAYV